MVQGSVVVRDAGRWTVGLDLGDRYSRYAVVDEGGGVVAEGSVATTTVGLQRLCGGWGRRHVALEVGTHSPWVSRLLESLGHRVTVANPRQLAYLTRSDRKSDRSDARTLARPARLDAALLHPVRHRAAQAQADRALLKARAAVVEARSRLVASARSLAKAWGVRLPACSTPAFPRQAAPQLPAELRPALEPLLAAIERLTARIRDYDGQVERLGAERYPEVAPLRQVAGVGPQTALAYVLTLDDPTRFARSREVAPYLGLVPRRRQSGERDPRLVITKAGDPMRRRLLVQCAHYILGPFGPDTDLRRWGLRLAGEGSRATKRRAVVAVARKLAVLLHALWVSGAPYEPLRRGAAA